MIRKSGLTLKLLESGSNPTLINKELLAQYIDPTLPRYDHILGVVHKMEQLLSQLPVTDDWKPLLLQACYLHDIGYSPTLNTYNYHQLNGAIFAHNKGFPKPVIAAVLFHSCAYHDALSSRPDLIDIYEQNKASLDELDRLFIDFVSYCDLHTSATGEPTTLRERIEDVSIRYGADHEVSMLMINNTQRFEEIIARVNKIIEKKNSA